MPRVDVWDIPTTKEGPACDCGFQRGLNDKYEFIRKLGEGGFGSVSVVRHKETGVEYACK